MLCSSKARISYDPQTHILTVGDGTHTTKSQLVGVYTANDFLLGAMGTFDGFSKA